MTMLANRVRALRGVNYLPTWARTSHDHWGPLCQPEQLGRELDLATGLGFNAIRIWLSAYGWEAEPVAYERRLARVLDAAHDRGLAVVPVLFDSCGYAAPEDATWMTVEQARARGAGKEDVTRLAALATPGHDLLGSAALVPVQWADDAGALLWQGWRPNPGYDQLGEADWPRWERYLRGVVPVLAAHPAVTVVDLMNEPYLTGVGSRLDPGPVDAHIGRAYRLVRSLAGDLPLAVSAERATDITDHDRATSGGLDVVSAHCYATGDALRAELELAAQAAAGRPLLLSEWGWFPGGSDEDQRAGVADSLMALDESAVGWAIFHLIAGYGPFPTSALLYANGAMRPAARLVRAAIS